ncbi:MAG: hypothetical protein Q8Q49_05735 [bacterium]|nr:hypothetical protein [bacterium]
MPTEPTGTREPQTVSIDAKIRQRLKLDPLKPVSGQEIDRRRIDIENHAASIYRKLPDTFDPKTAGSGIGRIRLPDGVFISTNQVFTRGELLDYLENRLERTRDDAEVSIGKEVITSHPHAREKSIEEKKYVVDGKTLKRDLRIYLRGCGIASAQLQNAEHAVRALHASSGNGILDDQKANDLLIQFFPLETRQNVIAPMIKELYTPEPPSPQTQP